MPSTLPRILVTSAAGHIGRPTVLQLLDKGFPVRAFVHRRDSRAAALEKAGAEIFAGDQRDFRDLQEALHGIQRAFHCPPFSPDVLYDTALFAVAAEAASLETVTLLGAWNPHAVHPSIHQRGHWIAGQICRWMPSVDLVHVTPGFFAFDYFLGLPAVIHFGQLMLPLGDGANAPPSNEDIARLVAATLAAPAPHIGKTYRPSGPTLLSPGEIAEIMARVLGRRVRYRDTSFRAFQKAAIALGYPISQIAHVRYYAEEVRHGAYAIGAPTNHIEAATGTAPEDFDATARRYFANPDLVYPGLRAGSRFSALAFLARMAATRPRDLEAWERRRGYPLVDNPELAHENAQWRARAETFPTALKLSNGRDTAAIPEFGYGERT